MKFFVQEFNDKFINNIIISLRRMGHEVLSCPVNGDIYRLYHKFNFDHAIFLSSFFTNEIAQFISEFHSKDIKFFIYHNEKEINQDIITHYGSACTSLSYIKNSHCVYIPQLLNEYIYTDTKIKRNDSLCCFIDHINNIPEELEQHLYPNSKLKIRLFNNNKIKHHQNLGLLNEYEKPEILNQSEYFLAIDDYYVNEASSCGCKIVTLSELKNIKQKTKNKPKKILQYKNFIESNLI
jgi:hypothetical protein